MDKNSTAGNIRMNVFTVLLSLLFVFCPKGVSAQWEPAMLPGSEPCRGLAIKNDTVVLAGIAGVYRNTAQGMVWEKVFAPPPNEDVFTLFQNGDTLLATCSVSAFMSLDFGASWSPFDVPSMYSSTIQSFFINDGYVFIGDNDEGLFRGDFSGNSWELIQELNLFQKGIQAKLINDEIWVGEYDGIYRSADNGNTWTTVNDTVYATNRFLVEGDTIIMGGGNKNVRSFDGGNTWENMNLSIDNIYELEYYDGKVYGAKNNYLGVSSDWGNTWNFTQLMHQGGWLLNLAFTADAFYITNGLGCIRSNDSGETWHYIATGLRSGYGIDDMSMAGDCIVFSTNPGVSYIGKSENPIWHTPDIKSIKTFITTGEKNGVKYGAVAFDGLYAATDNLANWVKIDTAGFPPDAAQFMTEGSELAVWNGSDIIYHSADGGITWNASGGNYALPPDSPKSPYVYVNDTLYYMSNGGVKYSTDIFPNAVYALNFGLPNNYPYKEIYNIGSRLFTYSTQGLFMSQDRGDHWVEISEPLENLAGINSFYVSNPIFGRAGIIIPIENQLYFTPDFGQTWGLFNHGLPEFETVAGGLALDDAFYIKLSNVFGSFFYRRSFASSTLNTYSGLVYLDENINGIHEPNEPPLPQMLVYSNVDDKYYSSGDDGMYSFILDATPDTLCLAPPSPYSVISPDCHIANDTISGLDFGVYLPPGIKDLQITLTLSAPLVPGFDRLLTATVQNVGSTTESGEVNLKLHPLVDFINADPMLTSNINDSLLTWSFTDLPPLQSLNFTATINTPASVPVGSVASFVADVIPSEDDATPYNNYYNLSRQRVVGSYDPNDKQVRPFIFTPDSIANQSPLDYTVRFQNTGNFPATFVFIKDTLSQNLDPATFRVLSSSHPMTWTMEGPGIVTFRFDNINLPDSTSNELASHGFVKYSIQAKPGLQLGDKIENTAYIYFDFNEPVVTNTTVTTVTNPLATHEAIKKAALTIAPNPTTGKASIHLPFPTNGPGELQVLSSLGKLELHKKTVSDTEWLDISALSKGIYFVQWKANGAIFNGKIALQ